MEQHEFLQALPTKVSISGDWQKYEVLVDGKILDILKSQKVHNHSVEFSWGYGGSGPAQFALALLLLYVDEETAHRHHHNLKFGWIGGLPQANFAGVYNLREIMLSILEKRAIRS